MSDSLWPHGLYSPWNSPGQNSGVVAIPFSRESSQPWGGTQVSCIAGGSFTTWAIREAQAIYPSQWQIEVWILLFWVSFSVYTSKKWLLPTPILLLIICVPLLVFIVTLYMIRNFFLSLFFFFFLPHYKSCRILVPQTGTEPVPLAMEAQRLPLDHQGSPRNFCLYFNNTAP